MGLPKDLNNLVTGEFSHGSFGAMAKAPCNCLGYLAFPACSMFLQRRRMMRLTKEPYVSICFCVCVSVS